MEAENYLSGGYGIRLAIESRKAGWTRLGSVASVTQPGRLKGIQVDRSFGTPYLAATQAFDIRPVPRKFLSVDRIDNADDLFVPRGVILITRSGSVGRATLAHAPHEGTLVSDDLLRVRAKDPSRWGWLYAFLRAPQTREMMTAAQYGHVVKHLEVGHLSAVPMPVLRDDLLKKFDANVKSLLDMRDRSHMLLSQAETLFAEKIGSVQPDQDPEVGFTVRASTIFGGRRRLEAGFHTTAATAIIDRFKQLELETEALSSVAERVWWMTRFKRVFGNEGVPYMSADELFALNPTGTKRVMLEQAENADDYYVRPGWLIMACSGQTYGLNGSVALMTERHSGIFFSHDLVRIVPKSEVIRPGYLYMTLGHPTLGRPLVVRYAYGTSIPHLEPADIATFPVVRVGSRLEGTIADKVEEAIALRAEADHLDATVAAEAEAIIERFIDGDMRDVVIAP